MKHNTEHAFCHLEPCRTRLLAVAAVLFAVLVPVTFAQPDDNAWFSLAREGSEADVTAALTAGADVNARNVDYATVLMHAAGSNPDVGVIRSLIQAGANVNARDDQGLTALMNASRFASVEVVRTLIDAGASVNARDRRGETALMYAVVYNSDVSVVHLLIDSGADVNARNSASFTALIKSFWNFHDINRVSALIESGADVNAQSAIGFTPLMYLINTFAYFGFDLAVAELLVNANADLNIRNYTGGLTALMLTVGHNKNFRLAQYLVQAGADVNVLNDAGQTALIVAAEADFDPFIYDVLLAAGADATIVDQNGKKAIDYIRHLSRRELYWRLNDASFD